MLTIKNGYDDRDVTIVSRSVLTGADGPSVNLEAGGSAEIEVDGENQVAISTRGRLPGEAPLGLAPVANVVDNSGGGGKAALVDASDDQVKAVMAEMVAQGTDLTSSGAPNAIILNAKLAERGLAPIDAARRDALHIPA